MELNFKEFEQLALSLPPAERARLAESLLESVHGAGDAAIEAAWKREIQARLAAYRRGEEETFDWEALLPELRRIAG
jgi:putative addiction module component (TIGR02574 family)